MRISDWSSDVCSSDLRRPLAMWRREVAGEKSHRMLQRAVMPQTRATHIHPRAAALAGACVQIEIKARQHVAIGVQYIVIAYVREIGRAPGRERVCPYVSITVGTGSSKQKQIKH